MDNGHAKEERIERTFATGEHCELTLRNVRGPVQILGWDRPEVAVVAIKRQGSYMGAQQAFEETSVAMDQEGPVVNIRTHTARGFNPFAWMGLGTTPPEVEYTVQVPMKSEVAVRSVSGPVQISDIQGSVYARSVNGDIYLLRVSGNVMVHGVSSRVSAQEVLGNLAANTVDGNIGARQSRLASFSGKAVSGNISLESPLDPSGTYSGSTVSGNMHLFLPADTRATVQLTGINSKVQCDLACKINESRRGLWRATLNGGGATVNFSTVSGELLVSQAGPEEPPAPSAAPAVEPEPPHETPEMAVLRAVEQGALSVDQALKRLEEIMGQ